MTSGTGSGSIAVPAGNGFAAGLGESFRLNLNTGQGTYGVTLAVPSGVAGHTPSLKLEYSSAYGAGPFGFGWRIPIRSIARRLDFGVPGAGLEAVYLESGMELVEDGGELRMRRETAFTRYRRLGEGWEIIERNGTRHELGTTAGARIAPPEDATRPVEWLLERTIDPSGNAIAYRWELDDGTPYLAEIAYAAYRIGFAYEARPDLRRNGRAGFLRTLRRRCTRIELRYDGARGPRRLRAWQLGYEQLAPTDQSVLTSLELRGYGRAADGSEDVVRPPQRFSYAAPDLACSVRWIEPRGAPPPSLASGDVALVAIDDQPLPGVLEVASGRAVYWANDGGGFAAPRPLGDVPQLGSLRQDGIALADTSGDGAADLVVVGARPLHGYYEGTGTGWGRFVAYPRARAAAPAFGRAPLRSGDLDGDGRIDALGALGRSLVVHQNRGADGWAAVAIAPRVATGDAPEVDLADPLVFLADMTGDGLPDLVRVRSGAVEYWPSLGHGRFGGRVVLAGSPRLADVSRHPGEIVLADFDGDGVTDLARVGRHGVEIWINRGGASLAPAVVLDVIPPPLPGTLRAADLFGTGRASLVWCARRGAATGYVACQLGAREVPYQLAAIEHGNGLRSELTYGWAIDEALRDRAAGAAWTGRLPFAIPVLVETREADAHSGRRSRSTYRYHDAHFSGRTRSFHGFARVEHRTHGDTSRPDALDVHLFHHREEELPGAGPERTHMNGLERRVESYALDGSAREGLPLRIEEADHAVTVLSVAGGRDRTFVAVTETRTRYLDRTDDERRETRTYAYDATGNVTRETTALAGTRDGAALPGDGERLDVTYAVDPTGRIVDRPARIVRRDHAGALVSEVQRFYDELPAGQVALGLLTRELHLALGVGDAAARYPGDDLAALGYLPGIDADGRAAWFVARSRTTYDAHGRKAEELDPAGTAILTVYDADGLFPEERHDAIGTTVFDHDPASARPTRIVDPDGSTVELGYDGLGRLVRVVLAGDSHAQPTRRYQFDDTSAPPVVRCAYRLQPGGSDLLDLAVYYDGGGNELQRRVTVEPGRVIVSGARDRNPWNDITAEYEPSDAATLDYAPGDRSRVLRRFAFDGAGRPVRVSNLDGGESISEFAPFSTTIWDARDRDASPDNVARGIFDTPRREDYDLRHQRIAVRERLPGGELVDTFAFDAAGRLRSHSDARSEVARYTYDHYGNRLEIAHRDAGTRRMLHDAAGRLRKLIDARGRVLEARYDAAGRLLAVAADGIDVENYRYDDPTVRALGRLAEVQYPGGAQRFAYDVRGFTARHEYAFDDRPEPLVIERSYDALGNETEARLPGGNVVRREYTRNGWLRRIPGVLDAVEYDARGLPHTLRYANGVVTTHDHARGIGHVARVTTTAPGGAVLYDEQIDYDLLGNEVASHDVVAGRTDRYAYDALGRLETAGADGSAPFAYSYLDRELAHNPESQYALRYDDAAHAGRVSHAVIEGGAPLALDYDANGNLRGLPHRAFSYDHKSQLVRLDRDDGLVAEYGYDHRGQRIRKRVVTMDISVETLFAGDVEVRDGNVTAFVKLGPVTLAMISDGTTRFVHSDRRGSARFFTSETALPLARLSYHPFGNLRESTSAALRLFALHPFDEEAGLYYLGRRHYAPELGRFTTPDPLYLHRPDHEGAEPRTLCLYGYVGNDPINQVDPTGLSVWSVIGAIVGAIVGIVVGALFVVSLFFGVGWVLLAIAGIIAIVAAGYLAARYTSGGVSEFFRGFLIGFNAGLTFILATAVGLTFLPVGWALAIGIVLGVIVMLSAFDTFSQNAVYQGVLGWSSWFMPTTWVVNGLGLVFFVLNFLGALFTLWQVDSLAITGIAVDWKTGTIFMKGGWISNLNQVKTAFDMGHFGFVHKDSSSYYMDHETGHTLSLGAFGSVFHLIGFIDEMTAAGNSAYSEKIAEGHDPAGNGPKLPMWS